MLVETAQPADPARIAEAVGAPTAKVEETLARWAHQPPVSVYLGDDGRVLAMWGVTVPGTEIPATPHRFEVDGRNVYTWCAIDTLYLVDDLQVTARVTSKCAVTREEISFVAGPDGVTDLSPDGAVLSILIPEGPVTTEVRTSFCHVVNFFASEDIARRWVADQDAAFKLLGIAEADQWIKDFNQTYFNKPTDAPTAR